MSSAQCSLQLEQLPARSLAPAATASVASATSHRAEHRLHDTCTQAIHKIEVEGDSAQKGQDALDLVGSLTRIYQQVMQLAVDQAVNVYCMI